MSWARIYGPDPAKEQMDRILRWHSHLKKAADTRADLVEIVDLALTVLLHCYHFKEWLVPGTGFNALPTCIQDAYSEVDLRLCQAVANGQKHFRLNNQTIIDVDYMIVREWEPVGPPSLNIVYHFEGKSHHRSLLGLCSACVSRLQSLKAEYENQLN